jgi:hypothetical protein
MRPTKSFRSCAVPESALNNALVPLKLQLAAAKDNLSQREWATLRAILIIYLTAEDIREEEAVA